MPPGELNRTELEVLLQVITKNTEQLVLVAEKLKSVIVLQEKTNNRLYNGISKEIQIGVTEFLKQSNLDYEDDQGKLEKVLTVINEKITHMDHSFGEFFKLSKTIALIVSVTLILLKAYCMFFGGTVSF